MTQPPLRDALRQLTRQAHLDTEAIAGRLLESGPQGYAAFLDALHALHREALGLVEQQGKAPEFRALDPAPRLRLLEQDLAALGIRPTVFGADLQLKSPAEVLGMLYVVEGSALGGPSVAKRVRALGSGEERLPPLRYLDSEGLDVGGRWRAVVAALEAFEAAHPHLRDEVIAGANRTFAHLGVRLRQAQAAASGGARR